MSVRQLDLELQEFITGTHKGPLLLEAYRNPTHFETQPPSPVTQESFQQLAATLDASPFMWMKKAKPAQTSSLLGRTKPSKFHTLCCIEWESHRFRGLRPRRSGAARHSNRSLCLAAPLGLRAWTAA